MTEPTKGSKIGNYEILSELGRGGMGIVYKAHEQSLQRVVALKVLPPHLATNDDFVKRFLHEARSAAQLNHPNIVITHAVDESDGHYYIAMEFVKGSSLIDLIREQGQLNIPNALKIVGQVAQALLEAHRHNIIHRDIKPHNIMIDLTGRARVMDFGLAYIGDQSAKLTRTQRKTRRSPSKPHPSTRCQTRHATPNHPNAKTSTSSHHNTPAHNDRCLRSMGILPPRNRLRHPPSKYPAAARRTPLESAHPGQHRHRMDGPR